MYNSSKKESILYIEIDMCDTMIIQFLDKGSNKVLWAYRISYHEKSDIVTKLPLGQIPVHTNSKNDGLNCSHCRHQSRAWVMAWIFFIHFSLHKVKKIVVSTSVFAWKHLEIIHLTSIIANYRSTSSISLFLNDS